MKKPKSPRYSQEALDKLKEILDKLDALYIQRDSLTDNAPWKQNA